VTSRASHPDDTAARAAVGSALAQARIRAGVTQWQLGLAAGLDRSAISNGERLLDQIIPIAQQRARIVGTRLVLEPTGLVVPPPTPESELLAAMSDRGDPRREDELARLRLACLLRGVREAIGVPIRDLAARCGWSLRMCSYALVWDQPTSTRARGVMLSTVQRLTRGLGGVLAVRVEPDGRPVWGAVSGGA
jgi:transcriptional regulator with XRE-family HTH domain